LAEIEKGKVIQIVKPTSPDARLINLVLIVAPFIIVINFIVVLWLVWTTYGPDAFWTTFPILAVLLIVMPLVWLALINNFSRHTKPFTIYSEGVEGYSGGLLRLSALQFTPRSNIKGMVLIPYKRETSMLLLMKGDIGKPFAWRSSTVARKTANNLQKLWGIKVELIDPATQRRK